MILLACGIRAALADEKAAAVTITLTEPSGSGAPLGRLVHVAGKVLDAKVGQGIAAESVVLRASATATIPTWPAPPAIEAQVPVAPDGRFEGSLDLMSLEGKVTLTVSAPKLSPDALVTREFEAAGRPPALIVLSPLQERSEVAGDWANVQLRVADLLGKPLRVTVNGIGVDPIPLTKAQDMALLKNWDAPRSTKSKPEEQHGRLHPGRELQPREFDTWVLVKPDTWSHVRVEASHTGGPVAATEFWIRSAGPAMPDMATSWDPEPRSEPPGSMGIQNPLAFGFRSAQRARPKTQTLPTAEDRLEPALSWLASHQSDDGRWACRDFGEWCDGKQVSDSEIKGAGDERHDVGVTGLALLAFLGAGYTNRSEGRFGKVVGDGLRYLQGVQDPGGCFGPRSTGHYIYQHAIASVAIIEAYGMTGDSRWRRCAQKALDFIGIARNPEYSWRYGVQPGDNDTSVTGWMVMALQTAKFINAVDLRAGRIPSLHVSEAAFVGVAHWLDKMTDPDYGRVGYQMRGDGPDRSERGNFPKDLSESMTAIGVLTRLFLGESAKTSKPIQDGAKLCSKVLPKWDMSSGSIDMYYWFWGSLAMWQMGGEPWKKWDRAVQAAVLAGQRMDTDACKYKGSWDPLDPWGPEGGRVYSTAIMALVIEAPYRYERLDGPSPTPNPKSRPSPIVANPPTVPGVPVLVPVSEAQRAYAKSVGLPAAFENEAGMRFVLIPPGTFQMGSPPTETGRRDDETIHPVTISPFYLSVDEVTNEQFRQMDSISYHTVNEATNQRFRRLSLEQESGTNLDDDAQPVAHVGYEAALTFLNWLSCEHDSRQLEYRLPTEAEWEYACRAGTTTSFSTGEAIPTELAALRKPVDGGSSVTQDALGKSLPVFDVPPNPWGLRGMHGNVREWCADWYAKYPTGPQKDPTGPGLGNARVARGGSWNTEPVEGRSAARLGLPAENASYADLGFRVALPVTWPTAPSPTPGAKPKSKSK